MVEAVIGNKIKHCTGFLKLQRHNKKILKRILAKDN